MNRDKEFRLRQRKKDRKPHEQEPRAVSRRQIVRQIADRESLNHLREAA